ncbi:MAG: hypothetical protein GY756_04020, partial [bacterium]|nr:hypothetical protein [bacterium]
MDKTVSNIILRLKENDIHIWAENNTLRYNAPDNSMTDEIMSLLKNNKKEIINYLNKVISTKAISYKK